MEKSTLIQLQQMFGALTVAGVRRVITDPKNLIAAYDHIKEKKFIYMGDSPETDRRVRQLHSNRAACQYGYYYGFAEDHQGQYFFDSREYQTTLDGLEIEVGIATSPVPPDREDWIVGQTERKSQGPNKRFKWWAHSGQGTTFYKLIEMIRKNQIPSKEDVIDELGGCPGNWETGVNTIVEFARLALFDDLGYFADKKKKEDVRMGQETTDYFVARWAMKLDRPDWWEKFEELCKEAGMDTNINARASVRDYDMDRGFTQALVH